MLERLLADGRVTVPGIYFDVGTADICPESDAALSVVRALLEQHPALRLTIEAHTDSVGAAESNQQLSAARAAAVVNYLTMAGISAERLQAIGRGATQPVVPNNSLLNRQRNRRIELVLQPALLAE